MLLKDRRFVIDELFFNRRLKFRTLKRYELGMMRVGNIKYGSGATGRSLNEVSPFKYLLGDTAGYDLYKYGEDYEVPVLKLELDRRSWFNKVMRYIYKKSVGFG